MPRSSSCRRPAGRHVFVRKDRDLVPVRVLHVHRRRHVLARRHLPIAPPHRHPQARRVRHVRIPRVIHQHALRIVDPVHLTHEEIDGIRRSVANHAARRATLEIQLIDAAIGCHQECDASEIGRKGAKSNPAGTRATVFHFNCSFPSASLTDCQPFAASDEFGTSHPERSRFHSRRGKHIQMEAESARHIDNRSSYMCMDTNYLCCRIEP